MRPPTGPSRAPFSKIRFPQDVKPERRGAHQRTIKAGCQIVRGVEHSPSASEFDQRRLNVGTWCGKRRKIEKPIETIPSRRLRFLGRRRPIERADRDYESTNLAVLTVSPMRRLLVL